MLRKYIYDVTLNLHAFMHVDSEVPEVILKKFEKCVKELSNFMGTWGVDNKLIVSPNKSYKIPGNI